MGDIAQKSRWHLGLLMGVCMLFSTPSTSQDHYTAELDQWDKPADRAAWYYATQGSRLIPRSWLVALEQPGQSLPFLDPSYIASFGYLPGGPIGLPVGFAIDEGPDRNLSRTKLTWKPGQKDNEQWVGMTCAACHTSQLTYQGKVLRVDGGPATADFQAFMKDLNLALLRTRDGTEKWSRFAQRVLPGGTAKEHDVLKGAYDKLLAWQLAEARINQTDSVYGPGRVDAFGRIYNKVALLLGGPAARGNAPDAPVSIPFIWHAPRRSAVQYNGIAPKAIKGNTDFGAVGRNTGEVIGVFGDVVPHAKPSALNGFESSVKVSNLMALENTLSRLKPPVWPSSVFGKLDTAAVQSGRELYAMHCLSCHELTDRNPDPRNVIKVKMNALYPPPVPPGGQQGFSPAPGTDPWMACNAFDYQAFSGPLEGFKGEITTEGNLIPAQADLGFLLRTIVVSTLLAQKTDLIQNFVLEWFGFQARPVVDGLPPQVSAAPEGVEKERRLARCKAADPHSDAGKYMGYTSRPLNGIWATAPYLHNGSVPTLYDLLLPPAQRPKSFALGTREYDPKKLGFAPIPNSDAIFTFETNDTNGRPIYGNSNAGHDYGNGRFSDVERYAIIEYLKSL